MDDQRILNTLKYGTPTPQVQSEYVPRLTPHEQMVRQWLEAELRGEKIDVEGGKNDEHPRPAA